MKSCFTSIEAKAAAEAKEQQEKELQEKEQQEKELQEKELQENEQEESIVQFRNASYNSGSGGTPSVSGSVKAKAAAEAKEQQEKELQEKEPEVGQSQLHNFLTNCLCGLLLPISTLVSL
eukprot:g12680.t1